MNKASIPTTATPSQPRIGALYYGALVSLLLLIALCLAWEIQLAPIRPGGSWLMLKALPLLLPLFGLLRAQRRAYQWASFLILAYFTEGVVRGWSDSGLSQQLALVEVALSVVFFFCAIYAARALGPRRAKRQRA